MRRIGDVFRHSFLMIAVIITLFPVLYTFLTSLKIYRDIVAGSFFFKPTLINYKRLFSGSQQNFTALGLNSIIVGIFTTIAVIVIGTLAAYSLTRFRWSKIVSDVFLGWLLFVHMIPPITFVGPFYMMTRSMGIYDRPLALILAHTVMNLPLAVWMLQSFFTEVPKELEEAAAIDGCSNIGTFWRILLPMARPGIAATAVLAFVFSWKEFLFALTLTSTPSGMTIPVGIAGFVQEYNIRYGEMSAAAFFSTLPALVFLFFAQKHIVKGLTLGALKG